MAQVKNRRRWFVLGSIVAALAALVALWNWDWFIPMAERLASRQLGRPVAIRHIHVRLARNPVLELDGLVIGNPPDFPAPPGDDAFARVERLAVTLDGPAYLHGRAIVVPGIEIDTPVIAAIALPDGRNNWTFPFSSAPSGGKPGSSPRLGDLRIRDGRVHAVVPKLKADFALAVHTEDASGDQPSRLVATADGAYAGAPITGAFTGGALLTLRDTAHPYPVDLKLANGRTHVALQGTVQDPLAFAGTNLKLHLQGDSLADLMPLTGVPIAATPPYTIDGDLTYAERKFVFENFEGRVGSSDLSGSIAVDPGDQRPHVTANLASRKVDLTDLGGFIGSAPGRAATPGQTKEQRQALAKAAASPRLLPDTPISLPRLRAADVDLHYKGERIQGRSIPFDDITADLSLRDGALTLKPVSLGVGKGRIAGTIALTPTQKDDIRARISLDFQKVDLNRLLAATHAVGGSGLIGGHAEIDGTGRSVAGIIGAGDGEVKLFMTGGDLSALLVDLSGLQFGNALLSALGLPTRTQVRCLVSDSVLGHGVLNWRTLVLDTTEANVNGRGNVDLAEETVDLQLRTEAKHFSVGSLPTTINISGKLKSPSIRPDAGELGVRGGLAVGLGVLLTPLGALLPTIQLGLGEDNDCGALIRNARRSPTADERAATP